MPLDLAIVNIDDLITEIRRLAEESPDNQYIKININGGCYYSRGECTNHSVGCIFGQAFKNLYGDTPEKDGCGIYTLLAHVEYTDIYQHKLNWCSIVQSFQDSGGTSGEAIKVADNECPL